MSLPVRALPVIQNWDCHSCSNCCREYIVHVTAEERQRIEGQEWTKQPGFDGVSLFKWTKGGWALNQQGGGCVFLDEHARCRIHGKFGPEGKPLACRVYPFLLVPSGDSWRVGLRFACPSAAKNQGAPINQHLAEVRQYARMLAEQNPKVESVPAPPLQGRQIVSWDDIDTFIQALANVMEQREDRVERRLRKCLALANLCRQAKFVRVSGKRLQEFLGILINAIEEEAPKHPQDIPRPTGIGRILFRQLVALYARKDVGEHAGIAKRGRLALLGAAVRFARGTGAVPRVHGTLPEVTFEKLEEPVGPWTDECELLLERYYLTKIYSMQFAGTMNFGSRFWDGLESLALTFPAIGWLSRAYVNRPRIEAVTQALRIVDDSFGYHPLLGSARQKLAIRILSFRGEIPRLIAWYGR
jgi:lysine-N-methylase